tara:strand:+ start:404 stop:700 length:297 start_codon:yes stop_codon:yes gene_type:complete
MYVHGLGDAQERMSRDEYDEPYEIAWKEAKKENNCRYCKSNKNLNLHDYEVINSYSDDDYFEIEFEFTVYCDCNLPDGLNYEMDEHSALFKITHYYGD